MMYCTSPVSSEQGIGFRLRMTSTQACTRAMVAPVSFAICRRLPRAMSARYSRTSSPHRGSASGRSRSCRPRHSSSVRAPMPVGSSACTASSARCATSAETCASAANASSSCVM